jgi:hypothetical protein
MEFELGFLREVDAAFDRSRNQALLCGLFLPRILAAMSVAKMEAVYVAPGRAMKPGDKLLDLTIDLGGAFLQNCPPVSHYRFVLRERLELRTVLVKPGDDKEPGACLAVFATDAGESSDGPIARPVRFATAAILSHPGMWSTSARA